MSAEGRAPSLTQAFAELEEIVAAFEGGQVDLERDLPKFERGLKLAGFCRTRLTEIENHIRKVEKTFHVDRVAEEKPRRAGEEDP